MNNTTSLKAAQIIRCINACISCLASTFIILMILTEPKTGLASPYSRIIFAMSISDVLFSLGMLLSPFMGPKDNPDALFAIGTTETCEAIGFIFIIGLLCLVFYTVFLTYYFMRRIKYKVTPQNFAKKEEKYFHRIFCLIAFFFAILTLATGSINPQTYGSLCVFQPYPEGCNQSLDMICERGGDNKVTKLLNVCGAILSGLSFIGIFVILALTVHHVYKEERTFSIPAREIGNVNRSHRQRQGNNVVADQNQNQNPNQMMLTKQAIFQSLLYILAFCVVNLPLIISNIQKKFLNEIKEPEWRFWFISFLTPLGGVFNILIYTRPKVMKMKEKYPNTHVFRVFLVVVITGGEIPSLADLRRGRQRAPPEQRNIHNNQEVNVLDEEERSNDEEQVNREEQNDDLFSYEMDISAASEYLSNSGSGRISSFLASRSR